MIRFKTVGEKELTKIIRSLESNQWLIYLMIQKYSPKFDPVKDLEKSLNTKIGFQHTMKNLRLLTIITAIMLMAFVTISNFDAQAMEEKSFNSDKMTAEKKAMEKKKAMAKKLADKKKAMAKKLADKKAMADKKLTDKTMAEKKAMQKKTMEEKTMAEKKPASLGGVDLSMASPIQGSADAKVTIIEFGDYQCPKCYSWFTKEKPTIESQYITTGKANLVFVDIPFLGSDSDSAAVASYCADEQGKYWEYHSKLYKNQKGIQSGWASATNLKNFASEIGLDTTKFNSCLDSNKYSDRVDHNRNVASSSGVQGTPTFLIVGPNGNTEKITGPQPSSVFSSVIDRLQK